MTSTWEPIQDWRAFVRRSTFWVWYYCNNINVADHEDPIDLLAEVFGEPSDNDLEQLLGPGLAEGAWTPGSTLTLPFPGEFSWTLEFDSTPAVHHNLSHPDLAEPVCLGHDDPHPSLPALLPWREARSIVLDLAGWWHSGPIPECLVLPLLIPTVSWQASEQDEVRDLLRNAWARSGMLTADKVAQIVDRLTEFPSYSDDSAAKLPTIAAPVNDLFAAIKAHRR